MCKVYNSVGSLSTIKNRLHVHNISDFNSINDLIAFRKDYSSSRQQIISQQESLIGQEKVTLGSEILELENCIDARKKACEREFRREVRLLKQELLALSAAKANIFQIFSNLLKTSILKHKIRKCESNLNSKVDFMTRGLSDSLAEKNSRYQYINSHFADAVSNGCAAALNQLERKKRIIDELNSSIYGALGEQQVSKELEKLSDEHFLINDFSIQFSTPIYNRQENDYIKSIQIDHILVSPSGVFLIETKNWSEESLMNLSLRSPVQQVKRTNFALFKLLNGEMANSSLHLKHHHWGERKIPIRNLIALINLKPKEEFQYVKILTLNELLGYVKYFKPIFSSMETREIANYLLNLMAKSIRKR
jgi:hypothetical protein